MKIGTMALIASAALLGACTHHVQTTSGADYLKRYGQSPAYSALNQTNSEIYDIASIEPDLRFPARIGIARIGIDPDNHRKGLTAIPGDESDIWLEMAEKEGDRYGEFVPVSPFITAMVSQRHKDSSEVRHVIDDIRKGAARQHLDCVLVYEVTSQNDRKQNGLGFTDATVLGLFFVPSRKVEVDTTASAILLDVRNGYPYLTASSFSEKSSTTTRSASNSKISKLQDKGRMEAIEKLSIDVENGLQELKDAAYEQLVAEGF